MSAWVPGSQWLTDKLVATLDQYLYIPDPNVLRVGVLQGHLTLTDVVRTTRALRL